ncbi:unnamed protein product [Orchesella dallaii]|uniref:Uncharacterized protein n=1 Tax=Orchesella dallaii TaxID=48710 RepID=A0ABP1RHF8_9HEXA
MALTLKAMGKEVECLGIQEKILVEMISFYGSDDWRTVETMIDVLNGFKTLGYFDNPVDNNVEHQHGLVIEPLELISLVKVAHERSNHLDTLGIRREMLVTLRNLDDADANTALTGLQDILGTIQMHHSNHEDANVTEIQIGITLITIRKYSEGLELFSKLKAKLQDNYGLSAGMLVNLNAWMDHAQRNAKT